MPFPGPVSANFRYVFLDRDGVINVKLPSGQYVTRPGMLTLCAGVGAAIARLNRAGTTVLVVTNQRGIALGRFTESDLGEVHARLHVLLAECGAHVDGIYHCPHDRETCDCRKPLPGMFHRAFRDFPGASPGNSLMIGDSLVDIEAGRRLGMATVFIEGDPETRDPGADEARALASGSATSLAEFVERFLG